MPKGLHTFLGMVRAFGWVAAILLVAGCGSVPTSADAPKVDLPPFRLPAVPLFVQTPYLNTWLCGARLADEAPKLWNGQIKGMAGMIRRCATPRKVIR